MKYVVTQKEMQACDANTINQFGMPSLVLMERAALSVVDTIEKELLQRSELYIQWEKASVLVVCGSGNNGGDGFAVARILAEQSNNRRITVLFAGEEAQMTPDCRKQKEIFCNYANQRSQVEIVTEFPQDSYDVVIDALFGLGLNRALSDRYWELIKEMNQSKSFKVSVDMPSGIHADTGQVLEIAFMADITVTFGFLKYGLILFPGRIYAGKVICAQMGITKDSFLLEAPKGFTYSRCDLQGLSKRKPDGNKGSYGKVSIFAGSEKMGGAAALAAMAAFRTGSGYVSVFTHANNRLELLKELPEAVYSVYEQDADFAKRSLQAEAVYKQGTVALIGPGIGNDDWAQAMVEQIVTRDEKPLLIDADACNIIAASESLKKWFVETADTRKYPIIMTPHLLEFSRLNGMDMDDIKDDAPRFAADFAEKYGVILVCKDACTVVANAQGTVYLNRSGNDGMATAGCGDVLSGIVAALLGQEKEAYFAACMGVYIHGLCGMEAAKKTNTRFVTASDLVQCLGSVLQ